MSDTDGTDDDERTGGLGKYSHGHIGLSHQHWVEQLISGGSFNVHCTESSEAKHKTCMNLSSHRVRHLRPNLTQKSMLYYLRWHSVFELMLKSQPQPQPQRLRHLTLDVHDKMRILLPLQLVTRSGNHICPYNNVHLSSRKYASILTKIFIYPHVETYESFREKRVGRGYFSGLRRCLVNFLSYFRS